MKKFNLMAAFLMSVFVYSCSTSSSNEENNTSENLSAVISESTNPEKSAIILAKDPRKIGSEKLESQRNIEANIYKINESENPLYGYWVGAFGKNKINIALAYTENDSIFGHSVCAGNFRPIKGTFKEIDAGVFEATMVEPGDDPYDGIFHFTVDIVDRELSGKWKPYKNNTTAKEYQLQKRSFKYDPVIGDFPDASSRYLEVPDVENLLPEQVEMIRNEIYARHGYSFTNQKIRRIFDAKEWYIPMATDIRDQLTELEAYNIDLLYNYEEYYDEYYNSFGR